MAIAVETLRSGQEAQEGRRAQIERAIAEATDRKRHLLAAVSRGLATDDLLRELEAEGQRERALNRELEQVDRGRNATADQRALERELVGV